MNNNEKEQIDIDKLSLFSLSPKASMNTKNVMRNNQNQKFEENNDNSLKDINTSTHQTGNDTTKESSLKSEKNCFSKLFLSIKNKFGKL